MGAAVACVVVGEELMSYSRSVPRFAANLGFLFPEHAFLERFAAARRAGFAAVEFAAPYAHPAAEIAARLRDNALACVLINLPMGDRDKGDFGIACRPGREEEFRQGVARGIAYAHALGVPKLNCISGIAKPGEDRATLRAILVTNLRFAAREFKAAGLDLVVEPLNTADAPGFLVPRSPEMVEVIDAVGEDNVGLQCDLYHTAMMGDDPQATLTSCAARIRHIQFADAPGRGEPGTGRLDFGHLFEHIDGLGYRGWVSAEYRPTGPTPATLSWLAAIDQRVARD
jgi:hydroxypyruvate isomerase